MWKEPALHVLQCVQCVKVVEFPLLAKVKRKRGLAKDGQVPFHDVYGKMLIVTGDRGHIQRLGV